MWTATPRVAMRQPRPATAGSYRRRERQSSSVSARPAIHPRPLTQAGRTPATIHDSADMIPAVRLDGHCHAYGVPAARFGGHFCSSHVSVCRPGGASRSAEVGIRRIGYWSPSTSIHDPLRATVSLNFGLQAQRPWPLHPFDSQFLEVISPVMISEWSKWVSMWVLTRSVAGRRRRARSARRSGRRS